MTPNLPLTLTMNWSKSRQLSEDSVARLAESKSLRNRDMTTMAYRLSFSQMGDSTGCDSSSGALVRLYCETEAFILTLFR